MHLIARPSTASSSSSSGFFADLLDCFPLVVTARVIDVGAAFFVGHDGQAARFEHLHHERSARTRQAGDEDERLARFLFLGFRIGSLLEQRRETFDALRDFRKIEKLFALWIVSDRATPRAAESDAVTSSR